MGTTNINITHTQDRPPSVTPQEEDLHDDDGVAVERPIPGSPTYSHRSVVRPTASHSGSSSHHGDTQDRDYVKIRLDYPDDLPEEEVEGHGQLSRLHSRERGASRRTSHPDSLHRTYSQRGPPRDPPRSRQDLPPRSPTESGDSAEDFLTKADRRHMPRPGSYHDHYPHSGSSGSHYAPPISHQLVSQHPPPHHYVQQYQPMQGPPPGGYPPQGQIGYHPYPPQHPHPASHVGSPYAPVPYAPQSVMQSHYAAPSYFPPQPQSPYAQPYSHPHGYPSPYMQYPPHMQMPPYVDPLGAYRVQSPGHASQAAASDPAKDKVDQEELMKRFEMLLKQSEEKKEPDISREDTLKQAMDQMKADSAAAAAAAAAKSAEESRIREEARLEAMRAIEDEKRKAADQAEREQRIRKEAAEAALKAAEAEAAAKAERAALEKKIAEDAAAAAKTAAEKEAADAAAKREAEAKKAQEEAEAKLKAAEEAAEKAKADAEAAEKKAAENAPPERKAPIRFKDALGRTYHVPFEKCYKWRDMEALINQAFAHQEDLAEWVYTGHYDLLGPDKDIIMPEYWRDTIQPDMHITMMLWELPKKKEEDPLPPPLEGDTILNVADILNGTGGDGGGRRNKGGKDKKRKDKGGASALGMWMLGGAPGKRHLKR